MGGPGLSSFLMWSRNLRRPPTVGAQVYPHLGTTQHPLPLQRPWDMSEHLQTKPICLQTLGGGQRSNHCAHFREKERHPKSQTCPPGLHGQVSRHQWLSSEYKFLGLCAILSFHNILKGNLSFLSSNMPSAPRDPGCSPQFSGTFLSVQHTSPCTKNVETSSPLPEADTSLCPSPRLKTSESPQRKALIALCSRALTWWRGVREDGTLHHTPGGPQGDKRQGGKESFTVMALMGTGSCLLPLSVFQSSAAAHFSPSQPQKHAARAHLLRTIKAWPSSLLPHRSSALASSTASPSWKMALIPS